MRRKRIRMLLLIAPLVFMVFGLFIYLVMRLWNSLMPDLFGAHTITYWQTLGLLVLCKILFGGLGGGARHRSSWGMRRRMKERWEKMTPEEREKFRQGLRGHGCPPESDAGPQP